MVSHSGYGFGPHGKGGTQLHSTNLVINECYAYDNNWDGFTINKVDGGTITNSVAYKNGRHGMNICTGSDNIVVENNTIYENGFFYNLNDSEGNGISVQSNTGLTGETSYISTNVVIRNNIIKDNAKYGINFKETLNCVADNNTITGNRRGIYLKYTTDTVIDNNFVLASTIPNCYSFGTSSGTVANNNFCNNDPWGYEAIPELLGDRHHIMVYASNSQATPPQGALVCDGTNDDIQIQAAINYFDGEPGTVELSDGLFNITQQIFIDSNLFLKGQGMDSTTIFTASGANAFEYGIDFIVSNLLAGTIRGISISNVTLEDFTGDGNKLNNDGNAYTRGTGAYGKFGFYCEMCNDVAIRRVAMVSYTGYGFDPHGEAGTFVPSDGLLIDSCQA